jgi:hypothetical protein
MQNELYHYGKKGQRWGVRRYQNKDGTLTEAGKKRYYKDADRAGYKEQYKDGSKAGKRYKTGKKGRQDDYDADVDKWVNDDLNAGKRIADEGYNMSGKLQRANEQSMRRSQAAYRSKNALDLSNMSDQEMRSQINRAMLERQYQDMFAPQKEQKGREFANRALETTGTVLTVGASAISIALGIRQLMNGS